jgi:hypothetical protein
MTLLLLVAAHPVALLLLHLCWLSLLLILYQPKQLWLPVNPCCHYCCCSPCSQPSSYSFYSFCSTVLRLLLLLLLLTPCHRCCLHCGNPHSSGCWSTLAAVTAAAYPAANQATVAASAHTCCCCCCCCCCSPRVTVSNDWDVLGGLMHVAALQAATQ